MENYYHQSLESDYKSLASSSKSAKLVFSNDVASPVFTKEIISGRCGGEYESLKVMLVDSHTGENITTGPLASAKVKIVLLRADCGVTTTGREFENNIVVNWGRKKNLLLGRNLYVGLKHGCGMVGEIWIKHDRNPLKTARFRLGAMVVDSGRYQEVKEAITNPFEVKDRRNMPKYSRPLSLEYKVWQLKNISKKGEIYKRLKNKGILTLRDFLRKHSSNAIELQEICRMKGKRWEMTVNQAKTSLLENMHIVSTSQQSNDALPTYDHDGSIEFDNNCYKPRLCSENDIFDENMIVDEDFSVCAYFDEFEPFKACLSGANGALAGGICVKVKKRWMKLRMFGFLIASFMKKVHVECARSVDVSPVS